MSVMQESFGQTNDGQNVDVFIFENIGGLKVKIINYGAIIVSIEAPDRTGQRDDVVLEFDDMEGCQSADNPYFGACSGRYANRIANGKFTFDGVEYALASNNGPNALHGGLETRKNGFYSRWRIPLCWNRGDDEASPSILEFTSPCGFGQRA